MYEAAAFFADKLVCWTGAEDDVKLLAEAFYATGQYRRAYSVLKERNTLGAGLRFRYLAALCQSMCEEWQECIDTLEDKTTIDAITDEDAGMEAPAEFLLGKAHQKLQNRQKACAHYRAALEKDSACVEAFDALVNNHLLSGDEERELLTELRFESGQEWLQRLYASRLQKYSSAGEAEQIFNSLENDCKFRDSLDVGAARAEHLFYRSEYSKCYELTQSLLSWDRFHPAVLPIHLSVMVELGEKTALFYCAHNLVDTYPKLAVSWYGVGCYYFSVAKYDMARRYFSKAAQLDNDFVQAWIAFGNAFAAQDESDQAMAAYRTSLRLFTGSHLPLLYMGMEYLRNNNILQARRQLDQAQAICGTDPLVFNEIGVSLYREKKYAEAVQVLEQGLQLAQEQRDDNPETWEPTMFNLAHSYRKLGDYEQAVRYYEQCLSICPTKSSTYTALGFTRHLQGQYDTAVDCYHKALGLDSEDSFAVQMLQKALMDRLN